MAPSRVIVLCVGNADRGDDGAGRAVARLLRGKAPVRVEISELDGEATALLEQLARCDAAFIVDACMSGTKVGTVHRFDAHAVALPQVFCDMSTHGFGVAAAIELARTLGQLPARTVVYAIEGRSFAIGESLSQPVAKAASEVADKIRLEIEELG